MTSEAGGALAGLRILDLSRVLAGPTCTQVLGDLGADIIKVERPGQGDDTRAWGPPFQEPAGADAPPQSAYFQSANRNKRSLTLDIAKPEGQALARALAGRADVLVENFKPGGLARYGLDYARLSGENPGLVYCSITGFGQDGPLAARPGYDALIQAMGGIMSITGEAQGPPMKVGVAIADIVCGLYAAIAILAALTERRASGRGQRIDLALFDCQIAWLANVAQSFLTSGEAPRRHGNAHPSIVPYELFPTRDSPVVIACGNDAQFARAVGALGLEALAHDPRFATNADRVRARDALAPLLAAKTREMTSAALLDALEGAGVPCGPVNDIARAFAHPQARARGMTVTMADPGQATGETRLVASPIKLSRTPVAYRRPPPHLGADTGSVLAEELGLDAAEIDALRQAGVI